MIQREFKMSNYIVETKNLKKIYSNGVEALKGVDIRIREGEINTLLGRNGAGKTTFIRIIATQLMPTDGEAYVYGYDVVKEAEYIRRKIAVVPQEGRTYNFTTPWYEVYLSGLVWGYSRNEAKKRAEEVLKKLELWNHRKKLCIQLSGGLRQRVLLARALVTGADLLMLDEPTIGIDPFGRYVIWNLIKEMKNEGKTVILTTHYMDEAEKLSDRIIIIDEGKVTIEGTLDELMNKIKKGIVVYIYGDDVDSNLSMWQLNNADGKWMIEVEDENELVTLLKDALKYEYKIHIKPPDLEDVFISLVGRDVR